MPSLHISTEVQMVNQYWDGEQYGDWSEEHSYQGSKVSLGDKGGQIGFWSNEIETSFEAKVGDLVYPVIVIYSTGNTFGSSSGNVTVAGIYNTPEKAQEVRELILKDNKENRDGYGYLEVPGEPQIYPGTWKGYFESLDDIRVEMEVVRP
jgi:hypothetical protein